jgi:hypothetical protein
MFEWILYLLLLLLILPLEKYIKRKYGGNESADDDDDKYDITVDYVEPKFEFDEKKEEYIDTHIQELKETYNYLTGPINLFLSDDEVKNKLLDSFNELKVDGKIINKKDFTDEYIKENNFYIDRNHTDMGRIFGAYFINGRNRAFKAPDFIIVVENESDIQCTINYGNIPSIQLVNAKIYFKEVKGESCANRYKGALNDIGYIDVQGDNGNLIKTDDGELYIVDTEPKSFSDHVFIIHISYNRPKRHNLFLKDNISYIRNRRAKLYDCKDVKKYTIGI